MLSSRTWTSTPSARISAVQLPAPQSGSPMTYMAGGQQFLVLAVSGGNYSGELIAYCLPKA